MPGAFDLFYLWLAVTVVVIIAFIVRAVRLIPEERTLTMVGAITGIAGLVLSLVSLRRSPVA